MFYEIKDEELTFLSIEEQESLMKSVWISIRRRKTTMTLRLNHRQSNHAERNHNWKQSPFFSLLRPDYAAYITVFVLLPPRLIQFILIERLRLQSRPFPILRVPFKILATASTAAINHLFLRNLISMSHRRVGNTKERSRGMEKTSEIINSKISI